LLLFRYTELQRQDLDLQREVLKAHTDLDEADKVVQDLQQQLVAQGVAADAKYEKLVRSSREEKYRAVSMEKTKRDHAEKMEREWKQYVHRTAYIPPSDVSLQEGVLFELDVWDC
jgi:chromosome condensin MukBEF ATPase and DNA-binding subunit MukB